MDCYQTCIDNVVVWFGIANAQILSIFDSDLYLLVTCQDFLFLDDNFGKDQWIFTKWIFTKLALCIDIVELCTGKANGQISSVTDSIICPGYDGGRVLSFHVFISKYGM